MSDNSGYIQFLSGARSGDQAAMGRLAVLVWEQLYPFVFRTTLDRDATEDVLQETLLTMLRRLDSLRDDATVLALDLPHCLEQDPKPLPRPPAVVAL